MGKSSHEPSCVSSILLPLYEYQNKGLNKFAIRKWLILKDAILAAQARQAAKYTLKEKRQQGCRTPNAVTYSINYSSFSEDVKKNF